MLADLPTAMIDGSGALDPVTGAASFIDAVHVDEDGAAIVAAALRSDLRDTVLGRDAS